MKDPLKKIIFRILPLIIIITTFTISFNVKTVSAEADQSSNLIKKITRDYTNKFCNSIAFGLSKESAMKFSLEENKKVFKKRKGIKDIDKELLVEEIANSIVENCGYPLDLSGETGIQEFKNYYQSKTN